MARRRAASRYSRKERRGTRSLSRVRTSKSCGETVEEAKEDEGRRTEEGGEGGEEGGGKGEGGVRGERKGSQTAQHSALTLGDRLVPFFEAMMLVIDYALE